MAAPERTLTQRELNRALLARQLLLQRAPTPLPKALERIGGIQAQYAPSMYIGLWSRLESFEREMLTRALERRTVVQGTLLRATIHLVSTRDWWAFSAATRRPRRESWLRYHRSDPDAAQMSAWIGPDPEPVEIDARVELVRSYLRGFGPASRAEIADWAGLKVTQVDPALERLELRRFRAEDGEPLVDLPRMPLPDPETPAPPRFLPVWDATMLVHARRAQLLPDEYRPRIFSTKTPQSMPTFLVDGAVAGSWRYEKDRIKLDPFARLDRATRRALDEEAERLAAFHR